MRKHRLDYGLLLAVLILMLIGAIIIFAVGPRVAIFENSVGGNFSENHFIFRHLISVSMSIMAIIAGYFLPMSWIKKISKQILLAGLGLCLGVAIFGKIGAPFVMCDEGACRAYTFAGFGFQPVELVKIGVMLYMAWLIRDRSERGLIGKSEFWIPAMTVLVAVSCIAAVLLKDLGSTVVIFFMVLMMIFLSGAGLKQIGYMLIGCMIGFLFLVIIAPHRIARLLSFSGDGDNYHIINSLIAIGTGGLTGVGLGNSIQSTGYLPETLSDSIFSVICEVWGLVGASIVLLIFVFILRSLLKISKFSAEKDSAMIAIAVFAWILGHVIMNVGGMTRIIPMKGITLPFLSYGGTSMMFVSYAIGLVLQISTWTKREVLNEENSSSWRGQRGTRYAGNRRRS